MAVEKNNFQHNFAYQEVVEVQVQTWYRVSSVPGNRYKAKCPVELF